MADTRKTSQQTAEEVARDELLAWRIAGYGKRLPRMDIGCLEARLARALREYANARLDGAADTIYKAGRAHLANRSTIAREIRAMKEPT